MAFVFSLQEVLDYRARIAGQAVVINVNENRFPRYVRVAGPASDGGAFARVATVGCGFFTSRMNAFTLRDQCCLKLTTS